MARRRRGPEVPGAQINVTPLVDVMLVLLLIFLVAGVWDRSALSLDLPSGGVAQAPAPRAVVVALDQTGRLTLAGDPVTLDDLGPRLSALVVEAGVVVEADRRVPYGDVAALLGRLASLGLKVSLETRTAP